MVDLTPAATLRTAATLIRETASNATPGPWHIYTDHDESFDLFWIHSQQHGPVTSNFEEGGVCIERASDEGGWGDAAWIALMSPAVAEPLAASLEDHAQEHDAYDCTRPEDDCPHVRLARSILGRQS